MKNVIPIVFMDSVCDKTGKLPWVVQEMNQCVEGRNELPHVKQLSGDTRNKRRTIGAVCTC